MRLSCVYSVFNRTELFARGLHTVAWQSMPREDFEIVVVDDGSTEDIKKILRPYKDILNIRYIRYDRTKHPIWQEMNPTGVEESWYHTQAISANIGISQAEGEIICLSQPEILHSPYNFASGTQHAGQYRQVFGEIIMANQQLNDYLKTARGYWKRRPFGELLSKVDSFGREYNFAHQPPDFFEIYWYVCFFPKAAAMQIGGVDLKYQKGVFAEDDQFKCRMRMAECPELYFGRPTLEGPVSDRIVGIHQSHAYEKEIDKKQDRSSRHWDAGAEHNRALFREFFATPYTVANDNLSYSPWGEFCITEDTRWPIQYS